MADHFANLRVAMRNVQVALEDYAWVRGEIDSFTG